MFNPRGPVVVGVDAAADGTASATAALELAAREALRRRVDLRLVYGHADLPPWPLAGQLLANDTARLAESHPTLAVTTAIYPGSTAQALLAAADTASLVVSAAQPDNASNPVERWLETVAR